MDRGDSEHFTLSDMIKALQNMPDLPVVFIGATEGVPGRIASYRGYYEDLAFDFSPVPLTVSDMLCNCREALGTVFQGYKGGDYRASKDTLLWVSAWGYASDFAIVEVRRGQTAVEIITAEED